MERVSHIPSQALITFLKECDEPIHSMEVSIYTSKKVTVNDLLNVCHPITLPTRPEAYDTVRVHMNVTLERPSREDVISIIATGQIEGFDEDLQFTNICFVTIKTHKFTITRYIITANEYDPSIFNNPGYLGVSKFVRYNAQAVDPNAILVREAEYKTRGCVIQ
jgi:hypothetical protein